ncbi:hypothetical protein COCOBI_pt-0800 (chloroplast) [Coccomyxa sp. Obi]|nr:hypothetical protein COCOBI_pt-0800 [Coccomyxa sp. Obi]
MGWMHGLWLGEGTSPTPLPPLASLRDARPCIPCTPKGVQGMHGWPLNPHPIEETVLNIVTVCELGFASFPESGSCLLEIIKEHFLTQNLTKSWKLVSYGLFPFSL